MMAFLRETTQTHTQTNKPYVRPLPPRTEFAYLLRLTTSKFVHQSAKTIDDGKPFGYGNELTKYTPVLSYPINIAYYDIKQV